jgi:hypothetical protein
VSSINRATADGSVVPTDPGAMQNESANRNKCHNIDSHDAKTIISVKELNTVSKCHVDA